MPIHIHGLRVGFATNSSSTHSVVLLPKHLVGKLRDRDIDGDDSYGWNNFVLASPEEKVRYLAAQMFMSYWQNPEAKADLINLFSAEIPGFAEWLGKPAGGWRQSDIPRRDEDESPLTVDHQSVISFNRDRYDPEFARNLIAYFKSPRVAVFGGNDNGGDPDVPTGAEEVEWLNRITDRYDGVRIRRDGEFYIGFDPNDGKRMRWTLDPEISSTEDITAAYAKASAPELVDLKITDHCDAGCAFCYQASTPKGRHAPFDYLLKVIKLLNEVDNFEIAIGGGEPTTHPDFARILSAIRENGMVPNFTTFSDAWLENAEIVSAVAKHVGGIGVSCLDANGLALVERIKQKVRDNDGWRVQVTAQHVVGSVPLSDTSEFLRRAFEKDIDVLLLGFKEVGFGKNFSRHDGKGTDVFLALGVKEMARDSESAVSIDTALADQHPDLIKALGAPKALVHGLREGAFSCYVDGVAKKMGASSYVPKAQMEALPLDREEFLARFAAY